MAEHLSDQELLAEFQDEATRERAFNKILKKYQEKLYWHVRRLVVQHEDANDVLQNTFIKIWNYLEGFRSDSNLYTWMYRIATNEAMSFIEKEKKRNSISLSDDENSPIYKIHAEPGFDAHKLEWMLQEAIQTLPEKQRVVFNLRYFEEMPYDEMAEVLETSAGSLKASYHHAVKKVEEFIRKALN